MDDYVNLDAVGLAERVRAGDVSPRELVDEANSRIDAQNPALNAVIHRFDPEPFLATLPDDAPLRGVPFLLKDELELADHPITLGSRLLKGYRAPTTHPVVQRFLDAGLIPLGRTNMSEVGLLPLTEPEAYGPTQNPWRTGTSPGGSSGGSAAAVAAGLVPMAQAGDGGGSIRIPASCCGLVGLKPSRGRHPFDLDDPPQGFVVHLGVSRTVRDAATLLDVVSGGDAALPAPRIAYARHAERDPAALRIGVTFTGWYGEPLHPEVEATLRSTAARLEALGHAVEEIDVPFDRERFSGRSACSGRRRRAASSNAPRPRRRCRVGCGPSRGGAASSAGSSAFRSGPP